MEEGSLTYLRLTDSNIQTQGHPCTHPGHGASTGHLLHGRESGLSSWAFHAVVVGGQVVDGGNEDKYHG